ncbi:MAG: PAS domain-containing protein [Thermoanaerobaculaceae bacterium]|jgi:transcriptional regulator with PAS, ATPase and Fis domain
MSDHGSWVEEFPAAITVTDEAGVILAMNARSREAFAADGGGALIGKNLLDCHPEPARTKTMALYEGKQPNHYTIRKGGRKKIIHQLPWYSEGRFAGFVEISIPVPDDLPHFNRD